MSRVVGSLAAYTKYVVRFNLLDNASGGAKELVHQMRGKLRATNPKCEVVLDMHERPDPPQLEVTYADDKSQEVIDISHLKITEIFHTAQDRIMVRKREPPEVIWERFYQQHPGLREKHERLDFFSIPKSRAETRAERAAARAAKKATKKVAEKAAEKAGGGSTESAAAPSAYAAPAEAATASSSSTELQQPPQQQ